MFSCMDLHRALKNNRIFRALTGITPEEFRALLPIFTRFVVEVALSKQNRKRGYGGGRQGNIRNPEKKLFFILVYLKTYPTVDVGAYMFASSKTRVAEWIAMLLPILEKTLGRTLSLPKRKISTPEEFLSLFP